jgi:hypothetical protein
MHIVKSVGVLSVAKIMGLLYGGLGLLFVPFFLLAAAIGGSAASQQKSPLPGIFGVGLGVGLAIMMPIFYGAMGFLFGAIGAFLYNVIAKWIGGFELDMELKDRTTSASYPIVPSAAPRA